MRSDVVITFNNAAEALTSASYVFAKTMPEIPHHYTLRKTWANGDRFTEVVRHIRACGYAEQFGRKWFLRLDVNGQKYWTMGWPPSETILINRAEIERPAAYDQAASNYDAIWDTPKAKAEDAAAIEALDYRGGSVLDIGCGTGLLLDHVRPERYLGIDPSRAMLARLRAKHPGAEVVPTSFESFYTAERFDLIVGLFGSVSYVRPETVIERLPGLLAPGGRFFLMCCGEHYVPVTHKALGISIPTFHFHNYRGIPGLDDSVRFNSAFMVLTGRKETRFP